MYQFSAKWEMTTLLFLFLLLPVVYMSFFSSSWKSVIFSSSESSLQAKTTTVSAVVTTLFFLLLVINFSGLIPFSFASSSQGWFSIFFSLSMFVVSILLFFFRGKVSFVAHLIPTGAPVVLGLILFWMEIISTSIRPFTLVLRLCANMTAGHVMLGLISSFFVQASFFPTTITLVLLFCGVVFFMFEMFVAFIQSLVFTLLLVSYLDEAA